MTGRPQKGSAWQAHMHQGCITLTCTACKVGVPGRVLLIKYVCSVSRFWRAEFSKTLKSTMVSPIFVHSSTMNRHSQTHRLILLSVDVEDMTLLDSSCVWVHEECLSVDHVLQIGSNAITSEYRQSTVSFE